VANVEQGSGDADDAVEEDLRYEPAQKGGRHDALLVKGGEGTLGVGML